jgi:uncharacterized protein YukE
MAADLEVTTESIAALKNHLETEINNLMTSMNQMKESMDGLNATWEGPNHDAYLSEFSAGYAELENSFKIYKNYIDMLDMVKNKYETAESEAENIAGRV